MCKDDKKWELYTSWHLKKRAELSFCKNVAFPISFERATPEAEFGHHSVKLAFKQYLPIQKYFSANMEQRMETKDTQVQVGIQVALERQLVCLLPLVSPCLQVGFVQVAQQLVVCVLHKQGLDRCTPKKVAPLLCSATLDIATYLQIISIFTKKD